MTTVGGRKTVAYLVKCALAAGDSLVKQDQNGVNYTFAGGIGICPAWKNGGVTGNPVCMEGISACMMAHVNTAGVHVPLWLDSPESVIGWGLDRANYPMQEGTFFGDIIDTGSLSLTGKSTVTGPVAYYCDGAGFPAGATGIVAGRLGANQTGAPYANPFGTGVLCQNPKLKSGIYVNVPFYSFGVGGSCPSGSKANPAGGCPDGYTEMQYPYSGTPVPWNHPITVWRNPNYTPVFDPTYRYTFSAVVTASNPMVLDASSSPLQQWEQSAGLASSVFAVTAQGSSWTISPINSSDQCVDAGTGLNDSALVLAACNATSSAQSWNITANPSNGSFNVAVASTGRCMNVRSASTAAGAVMEVYDCTAGSPAQQFNIQATLTGATDGATGTGGTGGATGTGATTGTAGTGGTSVTTTPAPCSSFCSSPVVMSTQSFQSGSLGTAAACYQTTFPITSYAATGMAGRTFSINGKAVPGTGPLPPKLNGGYCFQVGAGGMASASFSTL